MKLKKMKADARRQKKKREAVKAAKSRPGSMFVETGRGSTRPVAVANAPKHGYRLVNAGNGKAEILLYGTIGDDWWDDDSQTASSYYSELKSLQNVTELTLKINSGGGDVWDATTIYNDTRDWAAENNARVIVKIQGVAASAATFIAMVGDEIHMAENAQFMIHDASGAVWGNATEVRAYANLLDQASELIRGTYNSRTGIAVDELREMMLTDYWMTAAEAKEFGFIDVIDESKKVSPDVTPENFDVQKIAAKLDMKRYDSAKGQVDRLANRFSPPNDEKRDDPPKDNPDKEIKMNEKLRKMCVEAGMDASLDDAAAQEWLAGNMPAVMAKASSTSDSNTNVVINQPAAKPVVVKSSAESPATDTQAVAEAVMEMMDKREQEKSRLRDSFNAEVGSLLNLVFGDNVPDGLHQRCQSKFAIKDGRVDMERVRELIQIEKSGLQDSSPTTVTFADKQPHERGIDACKTALQMRVYRGAGMSDEQIEKNLPTAGRAKGYDNLLGGRPIVLANELAKAAGYETAGLAEWQIAHIAMGFGPNIGCHPRNDMGLHTTGTLPYITQDAINKTLLAGYNEAPSTWRGPIRQAESVSDFKDIHRIKLSAAPNLSTWEDNTDPDLAQLSNEEEKYAVEARAQEISYSWRMYVNDDMSAISRTPFMFGAAASRTVNKVAWSKLTANDNLADGQPLVSGVSGNRKQANVVSSGAGAPSVDQLSKMKKLMRQMRGLNTPEGNKADDILGLVPRYLVVPTAIETVADQLVRSVADPADNKSSAVHNPFRSLQVVAEPLLDGTSEVQYYIFNDPLAGVDTIELSFLQGQETPITSFFINERTMSHHYTIVQTYEAKAIDYRGIVRNNGA